MIDIHKAVFEGLRKRPTYNDLINQIDKPFIDKYPDRKATRLRNSNWLTQLDGDTHQLMETVQSNMMKEQEKEMLLKEHAAATGSPLLHARAAAAVREAEC